MKFSWFIIGPLLTTLVLAWFERLSETRYSLPDPAPLALAAVAFSGLAGGLGSAAISAVLTLAYGLHWYAHPYVPAQLLHCTEENLRRLVLLSVTTPVVAVIAGLLRRAKERSRQDADKGSEGRP